jgi:hypothetical protein
MTDAITETLAEIDAPHFNCGIVLWNDKVEVTAPIVAYMKGWSRDRVRAYCATKKWRVSVVSETKRSKP